MSKNALAKKKIKATTWGPRHNILPPVVALRLRKSDIMTTPLDMEYDSHITISAWVESSFVLN